MTARSRFPVKKVAWASQASKHSRTKKVPKPSKTVLDLRKEALQWVSDKVLASAHKNAFSRRFLILVSVFLIGFFVFFSVPSLWNFKNTTQLISFFIPKEKLGDPLPQGPINVLLVGVGGEENEAPNLTDSVILVSYQPAPASAVSSSDASAESAAPKPAADSVAMLSIPRDLWVQTQDLGNTKINELYARHLRQHPSPAAMRFLMDKVEEISGEQVDFYVKIDFKWFREIVDYVGGVSVDVSERIYDTQYPTPSGGWTTFSLEKGTQTLDGATALKFVRSRHSTSDFDRSTRQQMIVQGLIRKLISAQVLTSPDKIERIIASFRSNIETNFSLAQILQIASIMQDFPTEEIYSFSYREDCLNLLNICQGGDFLYTPQRDLIWGLSVLLPQGGSVYSPGYYKQTQDFAYIVLRYPRFTRRDASISVYNATKTDGIARNYALMLKKFGFPISTQEWAIDNIQDPTLTESVLYYNTQVISSPEHPLLKALGFFFPGKIVPVSASPYKPQSLSAIEIVLAQDAIKFVK